MERIARLYRVGTGSACLDAWSPDIIVGEMIFRESEQIPFDFKPDNATHAACVQLVQLVAEQAPGGEVETFARGEIFVAKYPGNIGFPRQNAERRRIRHDDQIGGTGHFLQIHSAPLRKRCKGTRTRSV
jgi:hypothetical protein